MAFRGSLLSLWDLGPPSGGREEPKSEARRAEMPAFGRGFFVRCAGPRAARPLEPQAGGAPLHRTPYKRLPATLPGPLAEGQGCRGRAPPTPCRQAWGRSGRVKGPCPRPYGAAGRTNPLTRPSLEKRARVTPRRGLEGHCRSGWGSRLAQRPRSGLALTPRNDPNAPGWWLGVLFPPAACHVANAPGGPPEALLICSCFARFRRNN